MYVFVLLLHSIFRWLVLIVGVITVAISLGGWFSKSDWTRTNEKMGLAYVSLVDMNVLLGFLLYLFLSPITKVAFANFGAAMGDNVLRFFAVEHIFGMIVALIVAHIGRVLTKKASEPLKKHRTAVIWYTLSLLVMLVMIPWDRPFLRLG
ncbi:MAG: hypothetical protein JW953_17700 [Anaerolineae bacterium]|nr:hypothetical protein [Anaerolineae bacterium]